MYFQNIYTLYVNVAYLKMLAVGEGGGRNTKTMLGLGLGLGLGLSKQMKLVKIF